MTLYGCFVFLSDFFRLGLMQKSCLYILGGIFMEGRMSYVVEGTKASENWFGDLG